MEEEDSEHTDHQIDEKPEVTIKCISGKTRWAGFLYYRIFLCIPC